MMCPVRTRELPQTGHIILFLNPNDNMNALKPKRAAFLSILAAVILFTITSGIGGMYVQQHGEYGWLFHVFSQKMPSCDKKSKPIAYDYTYVQKTDSVTMLSTFISSVAMKPLSVTISSESCSFEKPLELVYLKPKGKNFEYRLRCTMSFEQWDELYNCAKPFVVTYNFSKSGQTDSFSFSYSQRKWHSNREKLLQIINTIKLNTEKL